MQALREVRLYGPLRREFGRSHWLAVDTPREAVEALSVIFPRFRDAVLGHTGPGYRVVVGEGETADVRDHSTLGFGARDGAVIRIVPVIHGNKNGLTTLVLGVALFFAAPYLAGMLWNAGAVTLGQLGTVYSASMGVAKALMIGGLLQMVSPQRKGSSPANNESSYLFNGPVNVTSPGGAVPLVIGRVIVGSVTISAGLSTDEIKASTAVNSPQTAIGNVTYGYDPADGGQGP